MIALNLLITRFITYFLILSPIINLAERKIIMDPDNAVMILKIKIKFKIYTRLHN